MVQEEVAQKIVKTTGRGFGYASLFFQYYFDWELLRKVPKQCFYPQPSVSSRLLYFRPRKDVLVIPDEKGFWQFIRQCFKQPRRTIGNNLKQTDYIGEKLPESILAKRGQELTHHDFIWMWNTLR
jgi:16S rRNA (adenine1518-N6/adenine1519-N6)-dimethyltransferase